MKKSIFILAVAAVAVTLTACEDKKKGCMDPMSINYNSSAEEDDGSCQYAGTGGNATIVAKPEHHGVPIISKVGYVDTAYIKFNAINQPASYDLVIAGEEGEDHVHITGLKPGRYYIYMTGYDSTINERVFGGIPYTLTQGSGEVDLAIPVSE